ncbi:MAG: hypothetical protein OXH05_14140, partial [Acidobacteria bacterium]|nr:hypothetical protein [Acidobacteriota bacterium]
PQFGNKHQRGPTVQGSTVPTPVFWNSPVFLVTTERPLVNADATTKASLIGSSSPDIRETPCHQHDDRF